MPSPRMLVESNSKRLSYWMVLVSRLSFPRCSVGEFVYLELSTRMCAAVYILNHGLMVCRGVGR